MSFIEIGRNEVDGKWRLRWTILYAFIAFVVAFMFYDNGREFIDFIWWVTTPLVNFLKLLLG
jgi:hypothetical protein